MRYALLLVGFGWLSIFVTRLSDYLSGYHPQDLWVDSFYAVAGVALIGASVLRRTQ